MTKQQLIDSVATATGQTKSDTERVVEAFLDRIVEALQSGDRVDFRGFGSFVVKESKERSGRNPRTGEAVTIPAKRQAAFRPSKELKQLDAKPASAPATQEAAGGEGSSS